MQWKCWLWAKIHSRCNGSENYIVSSIGNAGRRPLIRMFVDFSFDLFIYHGQFADCCNRKWISWTVSPGLLTNYALDTHGNSLVKWTDGCAIHYCSSCYGNRSKCIFEEHHVSLNKRLILAILFNFPLCPSIFVSDSHLLSLSTPLSLFHFCLLKLVHRT